jgi:dethiobiotin synthetase
MSGKSRIQGVFVTGTDTGVGKTRVACALLAAVAARGMKVAGLKPISCGLQATADGPRHADALALMAAASVALPYAAVNPYAFEPPIAPHIACMEAGIALERDAVVAAIRRSAALAERVVIEGVGGFRVPLGADWDTSDLAADLGLPIVMVVGLRLGCLNHALLTRAAIAARGLAFSGWVGSALDPGFSRYDANLATLEARLGTPLGVLAHAPTASAGESARQLARLPPSLLGA